MAISPHLTHFSRFPRKYFRGNDLSVATHINAVRRNFYRGEDMSGECLVMRVMENIPDDKPITIHQLTCKSGLHHRTIRKYIDAIIAIQDDRKVVKSQIGLRVMVKRESTPLQASEPAATPPTPTKITKLTNWV